MKQFFPFGRGDRGSRQRLCVQFFQKNGDMPMQVVQVVVLQSREPEVRLLTLGTAQYLGKRSVFGKTQFRQGFRALLQAKKNFNHVRKVNKLWRAKRNAN